MLIWEFHLDMTCPACPAILSRHSLGNGESTGVYPEVFSKGSTECSVPVIAEVSPDLYTALASSQHRS